MLVSKEPYLSPAFMAREWERLWPRVWLFACHASEVARPGSFVTLSFGHEPLLVVRETGEKVRAFFNVCQHRGNLLCVEDRGEARRFRCGYHHWEYGLDGTACATPGAEVGPQKLAPLDCEVRFGLVFVRMSRGAETLDEFLGPIAPALERHAPGTYQLKSESVYELAANWKTSVDVNNENYHLTALHPELAAHVDPDAIEIELRGPHSEMRIPIGRGDAKTRRELAAQVRARAQAQGVDLAGLDEARLIDKHQIHLFPNVQLNFTALDLEIYRHRPHPSDPERMSFDDLAYVRSGRATPLPARRAFALGAPHQLGPTMGADVELLPRLQAGMRSRGFAGLCLTEKEECIRNLHRWLERYLED